MMAISNYQVSAKPKSFYLVEAINNHDMNPSVTLYKISTTPNYCIQGSLKGKGIPNFKSLHPQQTMGNKHMNLAPQCQNSKLNPKLMNI